jgi:hypothetical protein
LVGVFGIPLFLFFKILILNQDMHVYQYFYILEVYPCFCIYLYVSSQNKALSLLNPNLLKFLGYHNRFLRYLPKLIAFFISAQTF